MAAGVVEVDRVDCRAPGADQGLSAFLKEQVQSQSEKAAVDRVSLEELEGLGLQATVYADCGFADSVFQCPLLGKCFDLAQPLVVLSRPGRDLVVS